MLHGYLFIVMQVDVCAAEPIKREEYALLRKPAPGPAAMGEPPQSADADAAAALWTHHGCVSETGFINSQPSMAEFMTALPQLSGDSVVVPRDGGGGPLSPAVYPPGGGPHSPGVNVPEYPWMKEKKTARKNSQQGKISLPKCFFALVES